MQEDPGLPEFTIYRPRDLSLTQRLPVLLWGEGGCANIGNLYQQFNTEIASHGYIVLAIGHIVPGVEVPVAPRPTASTPTAEAPTAPSPKP